MCLSVSKQAALKLIDPGYKYSEYRLSYEITHSGALLFHKYRSQRKWRRVKLGQYWVPYANAILPILGPENVTTKRSSVYRA